MIGLPSYQTRGQWVPQLWEPLAQWVPKRVKVENFLYILRSSGPRPAADRQYYTNSEAPAALIKYPDIRPTLPSFLTRGKMSQILAQITTQIVFGPP